MSTSEGHPVVDATLAAELTGLPTAALVEAYFKASPHEPLLSCDGYAVVGDFLEDHTYASEPITVIAPEAAARRLAIRREVVRRAVGYLGMTATDLFGEDK